MEMADHFAFFRYRDQPGMIGRVGKAFGDHGVNIHSAAVGAEEGADEAVMAITTDAPVPPGNRSTGSASWRASPTGARWTSRARVAQAV